MRFESTLRKMESKSMATKLSLDDDPEIDEDGDLLPSAFDAAAAGDAMSARAAGRVTGKRASRDEPVVTGKLAATTGAAGFDVSSVSSLCLELLERKRMMLDQVMLSSSIIAEDPLARLEDVKVSDDDSDSGAKNGKRGRNAASQNALVKQQPMTEEDIQKRKAQRRREQVRAASRRCRDRQRRETEELRMKVFQLEEFISHTMQTYESELRRQRHQMELVQRENEALRSQLSDYTSSTASVASSPVSVGSMYAIKSEPVAEPSPGLWVDGSRRDDIVWDSERIQNMHKTTEDCKRAMLRTNSSTIPPAIQRQAFGWSFDFWAEGSQYFVKTRKFFRGMRAHDVADRNFDVDYVKYIETFPEVKEKKVLQWPSPNVQIVQTVKDFPGRGAVSSLSAVFISRDERFPRPGERWIVGVISVGSANALKFSHEDDCNGYIFEDATEVTSDGERVHGCLVQGTGRYEGKGQDLNLLMEELAKIFASVVIRWEGLFINDYMEEEDAAVDEIDALDFS